ncbi:hypothetical protein [Arthrobacter sp. MMS18-M83]|uniref:hypothetical protein n=1 Tax=Arthrobacter sp. MMS18-M83 TaxID=2996261 RepID=UPI00227B54A7|nr:hypothetical protein [Arthrobacter sp. MMS18-M83]WAH96281.1 hypothetical protein OW521_17925 [Arthrobacter sp. MMS18-M83]
MILGPLPVPTRLTHGEGIENYAARHAQRNGTSVDQIENALREAGILPKSRARRHPGRLQTWRELGGLHDRAFDPLLSIGGHPVIERELCLRCGNGNLRVGRTPSIGWVCLRHRRWLGRVQLDIRQLPELLAAERLFRSTLVSRGIHVSTPAMLAASECASACIALATLEERRARAGRHEYEMLIYPETVKIARLITRPSFKDWIQNPAHPAEQRRDRVAGEIARTIFRTGESHRRRAAHRIENTLRRLARRGIEWLA